VTIANGANRAPEPPPLNPAVRNTLVGCLTIVVGFFGGGMITLLLVRILDVLRRCSPTEGLPVCGNWAIYAGIGGAVGAVLLPTVVFVKLLRADAAARDSGQ
jgi:hypothetical protein